MSILVYLSAAISPCPHLIFYLGPSAAVNYCSHVCPFLSVYICSSQSVYICLCQSVYSHPFQSAPTVSVYCHPGHPNDVIPVSTILVSLSVCLSPSPPVCLRLSIAIHTSIDLSVLPSSQNYPCTLSKLMSPLAENATTHSLSHTHTEQRKKRSVSSILTSGFIYSLIHILSN